MEEEKVKVMVRCHAVHLCCRVIQQRRENSWELRMRLGNSSMQDGGAHRCSHTSEAFRKRLHEAFGKRLCSCAANKLIRMVS